MPFLEDKVNVNYVLKYNELSSSSMGVKDNHGRVD